MGMGSGFIEIHVDHPDAEFLQPRSYIKVRTVGSGGWVNEDLGGFWLERAEFRVLSRKGQVERVIHWEGEGTALALDRYVLGHSVYATGQTKRGDIDVPGKWTWSDEPYGAMLVRVLEEGTDHPQEFYGFLDWDFDRNDDTNGNPWDEVHDYQVPIGTSGLKLWSDFLRLGIVAEIDADLRVHAYRSLDEYRTDRSSATFAAGKVRFEAGINIASDMVKRINPSSQRTHVLIEDRIGDYQTFDENLEGDPIDGPPYMTFLKSSTTADDDAIEQMSRIHLSYRDQFTDIAKVRHLLGPGGVQGEEGYGPSPTGDYWLGDLVTVHTGTTEHDYTEQVIEVAALRYYVQGNEWIVEAELGAQYRNWREESFRAQIAQTIIENGGTPLCDPLEAGTESLFRFYASGTEGDADPAVHSGWDDDSSTGSHSLSTTVPPTDPYDSIGSGFTDSHNGQAGGNNVVTWGGMSQANIGSALAAVLASGGGTIRGQFASRARDVFNSHQDVISNLALRVFVGASTTERGTAYAPHTLASSSGSVKFPAVLPHRNATYPPAAASVALTAVPGTVSTDRIVLELGGRNFYTGPGGFAILPTSDDLAGSDLPEDDSSARGPNGWIEIRFITDPVGDGKNPELVGTSLSAARCDHSHHVLANRAPSTSDNAAQGYPDTTLWTDTDSGITYLLIDADAGSWIVLTPGGEHTHDASEITGLESSSSGLPLTAVIDGVPGLVWDENDSLIGDG